VLLDASTLHDGTWPTSCCFGRRPIQGGDRCSWPEVVIAWLAIQGGNDHPSHYADEETSPSTAPRQACFRSLLSFRRCSRARVRRSVERSWCQRLRQHATSSLSSCLPA